MSNATQISEVDNPNSHIKDYLDQFVAPDRVVSFALLLNGPWGIGKTHFIRQYFQDRNQEQSASTRADYLYVSLFGVSSPDELKKRLFSAAYPILSGNAVAVAGSIAQSVLGIFNFNTNIELENLKPLPSNQVIVVDDIERCSMPLQDAFGLLNNLIEHEEHKLILIGNEDDIPPDQKKEYLLKREKVIGQTLTLRPDLRASYAHFMGQLTQEDSKNFFVSREAEILAIFRQSGTPNLRLLQQFLWTFERLLNSIPLKYQDNADGMRALLNLLLPLSIEYRAGHLLAENIRERTSGLRWAAKRLNKKDKDDPITPLEKKYIGLNLRDEILSNRTLTQILIDGHIDPDAISKDLDQTSFYSSPETENEWRTVWWCIRRKESDFDTARLEMLRKFDAREYTDPGIILHVCMLRFWLQEMGYISSDRPTLEQEAFDYINDATERGDFMASEPRSHAGNYDVESQGLGFVDKDKPEFQRIRNHLQTNMSEANKASRPEWAKQLLGILQQDPHEFLNAVCYTQNGRNVFIREPVLHEIEPSDFTEAVLRLAPELQHIPWMALHARYENNELNRDLQLEQSWFELLRKYLAGRASRSSGVVRYKYELIDRQYFAPILDAIDEDTNSE